MRRLALLCVLVACGGDESTDFDARPGETALTCESGGTTFPALDKTCEGAFDCFVAVHTINCCGTQIAVGLNVASEAAFDAAEAACDQAYPGCGCAQFPTTAEDGRTEDLGPIQVGCRVGLCYTFVP